jgi:copper homeostasis protein
LALADILLEVCVDNAAGLSAAVEGGADRIELCSALELGGLTPSFGLMKLAARQPLPVYAMIRPRAGDFVFDANDLAVMRDDIAIAREAGLVGVVLGASQEDGQLDADLLSTLVDHSYGLGLTLHRAFDCAGPNFADAVETAIELGFERILTSGGATNAIGGLPVLERLFEQAKGRISVMPGAGINAENATLLKRNLPLKEVHGSCSTSSRKARGSAADLAFVLDGQRQTSAELVCALKSALTSY